MHDDNGTDENIRKPALRDAPGLLRGLRSYLDPGSCFMRCQLAISWEPWNNDVVQSALRLPGPVAGKMILAVQDPFVPVVGLSSLVNGYGVD